MHVLTPRQNAYRAYITRRMHRPGPEIKIVMGMGQVIQIVAVGVRGQHAQASGSVIRHD
jgi:hypothetical protein